MNELVSFLDTKILKLFILISASFLFLSAYHLISKCKNQPLIYELIGENVTNILVCFLAILVLLFLPIYWEYKGAIVIRRKIIKKIKDKSYTFFGKTS